MQQRFYLGEFVSTQIQRNVCQFNQSMSVCFLNNSRPTTEFKATAGKHVKRKLRTR